MDLPRHAGRYEVTGLLGRGGMGVVYKATDTRTGSTVALKSLPKADPSALMRFKQEFRSLADISHPNLATLFELFALDDAWWLAMEFVDGTDLLSYLRGEPLSFPSSASSDDEETSEVPLGSGSGGSILSPAGPVRPITPDQIGRLRQAFAQLASALYELHANDTLHRDVKPSNVMVDRAGRTVLLDFGLATAISESRPSDPSAVLGTVAYMAPEQAAAATLTPAADWYAAGLMLYEALVGRLPFVGSTTDVVVQKLLTVPASPRTLNAGLPADLCDLCDALLAREPERRPGGRDVLSRLGVSAPAVSVRGDEVMVGRGAQVQALRTAFDRVRGGTATTVFVQGPSGAGKSHLVRHFLAEARAVPGAVVLSGRCYEDESVPYKAVDGLIDALNSFLAGLPPQDRAAVAPRDSLALIKVFPVLREIAELWDRQRPGPEAPDPQEMRRRAFRGLRELLARLGDRCPLVLHVDDLQWGDVDSAALFAEIVRPPDAPVLLLLGAYRSEHLDTSACLRSLYESGAHDSAVTVDVGPLDPAQARALAMALLPPGVAGAEARADRIVQGSGGIPIFIHELARGAASGAELESAGAGADLDLVIRRRVDDLPAPARAVLEMVAVCGHPLTRQSLAGATAQADRGTLRLLRTGHFIRTTGAEDTDWVEPYHDRIREAVSGRLDHATTQSLHRQLAVSLEQAGSVDAETLAVHFEGGGLPERAGFYCSRAADAASDMLAFERASKLYARALDLHRGDAGEARRLRSRLADALANSGRGPEAAREYLAASSGAPPSEAVDLQRKAAYQYCVSGHLDEGRATLRRLLASIQVSMPERRVAVIARLLAQRARLRIRGLRFTTRDAGAIDPRVLLESDLTWAASAGLSMFDVIAGAEFQSRNLYHALNAGEPYRVARALAWEAAHTSNAGSPAWSRTSRLLDAARAIANRLDDPHAHGMTAMSSGIAEFTMGRWAQARDRLVEASETLRSRCQGVAWELDTAHTFELWARIYMGDLTAMTARTSRLLEEASARGDRYAVTHFGCFMVPHTHLTADDPEQASATVDRALQLWGIDGYHLQHMTALMMRVYIDLYRGDGTAALDRLVARRGWVRAGFFSTIQVMRIVLASLEGRAALMAAASSSDRTRLCSQVNRSARRIERERVAWARPMARMLRAGLAVLEGRSEPAVSMLESAAAEFDQVPMAGYAAAARWRAAALLGSGERAQRLRADAEVWMARESVRSPDRTAAMLAFAKT